MRRLCALLLLLGIGWLPNAGAWAHAALVGSTPRDGESLAAPPPWLELRFDEAVIPLELRLAGPRGATALPLPSAETAPGIQATLPAAMPPGTYIASYRIISADGHPVSGAIAFGIGMAPERATAVLESPAIWTTAAEVLRFLLYLGFALGAGGALFAALVAPLPEGTRQAARHGALLGAAASLLGIGVQGGDMLAAPGLEALSAPATWAAATASTVFWRSLAVGLGLLVVALAHRQDSHRTMRALGLLGALGAAAGLGLSGHSTQGGLPVQLMLAVHALAAAYWLGALPPLLALLRRDGRDSLPIILRFARLAMPAVAMLLLTGVLQAALHLRDAAALVETRYGVLLLAKAALLLLLLALAGVNHWRLTPALRRRDATALSALQRSICAEIGLGLAVLAATAMLTMTSPHAGAAHRPAPHGSHAGQSAHSGHRAALPLPVVTLATEVAGLSLTLQATPAQAGANELRLWITQADGTASAAPEVWLELSMPQAGLAGIRRPMQRLAPGQFRFQGPELAVAGSWTIQAEILVSDFEQLRTRFTLPVSP